MRNYLDEFTGYLYSAFSFRTLWSMLHFSIILEKSPFTMTMESSLSLIPTPVGFIWNRSIICSMMEIGNATWRTRMSTERRTQPMLSQISKSLGSPVNNFLFQQKLQLSWLTLGLDFTWSIEDSDVSQNGKWPFNHLLGDNVILDCQADPLANPKPFLSLMSVNSDGVHTQLMDSTM